MAADTPGFNVYPGASIYTSFHNERTYSKFFKNTVANRAKGEKARGTVEGDAFQSFEQSPDGLTVTMKLRPDTTYDPRPPTNGRKITMDDVTYSWQQFLALHRSRAQIANQLNQNAPIQSLTTPDANTAVFKLAFPSPSLLPTIAYTLNAPYIYPVEANGQFDPGKDMRGSGPWILEDYAPSAYFKYRRNPNYYDKSLPILDGIDFPIIADTASQMTAFRAGQIYNASVQAEDIIPTKKSLPDLRLLANDLIFDLIGAIWFDFRPNSGSIWFDDRLRQAMSMSIDRDLMINQLGNVDAFTAAGLPVQTAWNSIISCSETDFWLDPKGKDFGDGAQYFQYNVAEATKLVKAATGKDKVDSDWTVVSGGGYGADYEKQAEVLQQFFNDGPFKMNYVGMDYNTEFVHKVSTPARLTGGHDFNGAAYARVASFPEIDSYFANHLTPGGSYFKFEENFPPADDQWYQLLNAQRVEQDPQKRVSIIQDFQRYAAKKMYVIAYPGQASTFSLSWPWAGNVGTYATRGWPVDTDLWLWFDQAKKTNGGR